LKLFAGPYLWKYTNLLPNSIEQSQLIREQTVGHVRLPTKNKSMGSTRHFKYDLDHIDCRQSLDELMSHNTWSRQSMKRYQRKRLPTTIQQYRRPLKHKRNDHFYQLRLTRKCQPVIHLSMLTHFPTYDFDMFFNSFDKYPFVNDLANENTNNDCFNLSNNECRQLFVEPLEYDFIRPIHYDKIEVDRNFSTIDAKQLQIQLVDEYRRQSVLTSTPITLSSLFVELVDHGWISNEKDQIVSAFYCMLNNCHRNHLYMINNLQCDDLIIQTQLSVDSTPISYSHSSI
jgi:uncharacterized protein YbgA (DUF1722 family)